MRIEFLGSSSSVMPYGAPCPDSDGVVVCRSLAYGITPRAVGNARRFLDGLGWRDGTRCVVLEVGCAFSSPPSVGGRHLLEDLDGLAAEGVLTVAAPHGSLSGAAMELSLTCAAMTMDYGAAFLPTSEGRDRDLLVRSMGALSAALASRAPGITADEALRVGLVDVLSPSGRRVEAALAAVARRLATVHPGASRLVDGSVTRERRSR